MSKINFNDYVYYDETSPSCLRWKINTYSGKGGNILERKINDPVGCNKEGRYLFMLHGKMYLTYRVIYEMLVDNLCDSDIIDHIDRDCSNNKLSNLRKASHSINMRNRRKFSNDLDNTGVRWHKKSGLTYATAYWRDLDGRQISGCFSVKKLGLLPAYQKALICRKSAIEDLNIRGAGYTNGHGY